MRRELRPAITEFHERLAKLAIPHQFSEVKAAGHVCEKTVGDLGGEGPRA